uniref:Homeobox domain-containing protein n=1 Tax=Schizophyllum commune (strain H4-8 / FGSC 9210) TaxID=578458 RepID=D8Q507_SCHCM
MQPSSSSQPAPSQRNASGSSTAKERRRTSRATSGGDKKKRQRVTSDQLAHLESIFAVEHTPTQERRRQISQALGMEEKQTKVWFQNRAKMNRESKDGSAPAVISPGTDNLMQLFREQEVTFLPTVDLRIGSWRRIRNPETNDLAGYVCPRSRSLCWFVHAGGRRYEMSISFDSIIKIDYNEHPVPDNLFAFIHLSQPPTFWSHEPRDTGPNAWQLGTDWTEDHQATSVLTHVAAGSKPHLVELQRLLMNDRSAKHGHATGQASSATAQGPSLSPLMPSERQDAAAATQSHLGRGHPASNPYSTAPAMQTQDSAMPPSSFLSQQPLEPLNQETVLAAPVPTKPPLILPVHQQSYEQPWSAGPPSVSPPRTTSSEISAYSLPPNLPAPPIPPSQPTSQPSHGMPNGRMMPPDTMNAPHQSMPPPPPPHTMPPPSMTAHSQAAQQGSRRSVSYQMPERVTRQNRRHEPYDVAAHSSRRASTGSALQPPSAYGSAGTQSYAQAAYAQQQQQQQQQQQPQQPGQTAYGQGEQAQRPNQAPPAAGMRHAPAIRRLSVSFGQKQPVDLRLDDDASPEQYQPPPQQVYNLPPPSAYGSAYQSAPPASFPPAPPPGHFPPVPPPQSFQAPEPARHTPQSYGNEASTSRAPSPEPTHKLPDSPLLTKPWIPPPHILENLKRGAEAAEAEKRAEAARKKAEAAKKAAEEAQRAAEEAMKEAEAEEAAQREIAQRAAQREAAEREAAQREAAQRMMPPIQEGYNSGAYYSQNQSEYYAAQNYGVPPPPPESSAPSSTSATPTPPAQYVYDPTTGMYMNIAYQYR